MTGLVPDGLRAVEPWRPERQAWLRALPGLVGDLLDEWGLTISGASTHGQCALVVPVRRGAEQAMLKVTFPHEEAATEHLALRAWHGQGAVRLLAADPRRYALLLERAGEQIACAPAEALWACEQIAGLYPLLHRPAPPTVPRLSERVADWGRRLRLLQDPPLPPRLVTQAITIAERFADDTDAGTRLLHGDLHYENVLASPREDADREDAGRVDGGREDAGPAWLAIDPKPLAGDPHAEIAPLLWNLLDDHASPGTAVRERFETVVDVAGFDEARARDWVVLRMIVNAMWSIEDAAAGGVRLDRSWLTRCVTIAKSVP